MTQASVSVHCAWEGCRLRTRDATGYCHHHRRFSTVYVSSMHQRVGTLRTHLIAPMAQASPERFADSLRRSYAAQGQRTRAVLADDGAIRVENFVLEGSAPPRSILWGEDRNHAVEFDDGFVKAQLRGNDLLFTPHGGKMDLTTMQSCVVTAKYRWYAETSVELGLRPPHGPVEIYDDEPEILAGLELGTAQGQRITYMSRGDRSETVRVTNSDGVSMIGTLSPVFPVYDDAGEILTCYELGNLELRHSDGSITPGSANDPRFGNTLRSIIAVRDSVSRLGVYDLNTGKILMPFGWTDL